MYTGCTRTRKRECTFYDRDTFLFSPNAREEGKKEVDGATAVLPAVKIRKIKREHAACPLDTPRGTRGDVKSARYFLVSGLAAAKTRFVVAKETGERAQAVKVGKNEDGCFRSDERFLRRASGEGANHSRLENIGKRGWSWESRMDDDGNDRSLCGIVVKRKKKIKKRNDA